MLDASKLSAKVLGETYGHDDQPYMRKTIAAQIICVEYHTIANQQSLVAADNWMAEVLMELALNMNLTNIQAAFGFRRTPFLGEQPGDTLEVHVDDNGRPHENEG